METLPRKTFKPDIDIFLEETIDKNKRELEICEQEIQDAIRNAMQEYISSMSGIPKSPTEIFKMQSDVQREKLDPLVERWKKTDKELQLLTSMRDNSNHPVFNALKNYGNNLANYITTKCR